MATTQKIVYVASIFDEDMNTGNIQVGNKHLSNKCLPIAIACAFLRFKMKSTFNIREAHKLAGDLIKQNHIVNDEMFDTFHPERKTQDQQIIDNICDTLQVRIGFFVGHYYKKMRICSAEPNEIHGDENYSLILGIINIGPHFEAIKNIQSVTISVPTISQQETDYFSKLSPEEKKSQIELLQWFEKQKLKTQKKSVIKQNHFDIKQNELMSRIAEQKRKIEIARKNLEQEEMNLSSLEKQLKSFQFEMSKCDFELAIKITYEENTI
jgi:hypothetical protein